jgi:hypothetical protein
MVGQNQGVLQHAISARKSVSRQIVRSGNLLSDRHAGTLLARALRRTLSLNCPQCRRRSICYGVHLAGGRMTDEIKLMAIGAAGVALVVLVIVAGIWIARRNRPAVFEPDQIALISERVTFSLGGVCAVVLLLVWNVAAAYLWISQAIVISETLLAMFWVGGNVLWGIGILVGRRRAYVVYKMPPAEEG